MASRSTPLESRSRLHERVLLAAIQDIQGSIRANDGKHSAALITHGLLFAGTTNVVIQVDEATYEHAPLVLKIVGLLSAGVALLAFAWSLTCLLRAIAPHRPDPDLMQRMVDGSHPPGVFFPDLERLSAAADGDELATFLRDLEALDDSSAARELGFELIKVQDILNHDRRWAREGFKVLKVEIAAAVVLLSSVAVAILTRP